MSAHNLVIVESPTKADTIGRYLGKDFIVTSSMGHIRDLDEKKLSVDVAHDFTPSYEIPQDKKKLVKELQGMVSKVDQVWLASDEDREGEAISWHLAQTLGLDVEKTKRIVFHEITKEAIQNAILNPRTIDMNLVDAQQARRVLDRLVGFELSPVLWRKIQRNLSAGRVQSVALRLIVDREREILAFGKESYYRVEALFRPEGENFEVKAVLGRRFPTIEEAEQYLRDSIGGTYTIAKVEKKEASRYPAPPFTTSTLQQEASRKLHLSVNVTMRIAQQLYEKGLITYMRTDSTNLSNLALSTAAAFIKENYGEQYHHLRKFQTKSKGAQEAHEAIRPTFISNTRIQGSPQEQKLYELIWKRTVASQMEDASLLKTEILISGDGAQSPSTQDMFSVQSSEIVFDGFLKVYIEGTDDTVSDTDEVILPPLSQGQALSLLSMNADCKFTTPPPRYSDATLIKKLEELGIGRPSTYSPTISTLTKERGYVVKGNKEGEKVKVENLSMKNGKITRSTRTETIGAEKYKLLPLNIGMATTDYLTRNFPDILDYEFTANVEKDFDLVADGKLVWNKVIEDFYGPFHDRVVSVMEDKQYGTFSREIGRDPRDGQMIYARLGQWGPYVQKGEGENRHFANLDPDQLIETITLEEAVKLLSLPRTLGVVDGVEVVATSGRYGPFVKFGERNASIPKGKDPLNISLEEALSLFTLPRTLGRLDGVDVVVNSGKYGPYVKYGTTNKSLPKGTDPMKVTLEECTALLKEAPAPAKAAVIKDFPELGAQVLEGRFGPYIKHTSGNFKIPAGTPPSTMTREQCEEILSSSKPTGRSARAAARSAKKSSKKE